MAQGSPRDAIAGIIAAYDWVAREQGGRYPAHAHVGDWNVVHGVVAISLDEAKTMLDNEADRAKLDIDYHFLLGKARARGAPPGGYKSYKDAVLISFEAIASPRD